MLECLFGHQWEREGKRFFTPPEYGTTIKNTSEELFSFVIYGFTTIELTCIYCGKLKHILQAGDLTGTKDVV